MGNLDQANRTLVEMIEIISSNHESGRLEMNASATFFFKEGKLLDARLGSLTGFQALNAALSVRDARFTFDPSSPMPISSSITPNERVVLKQFFGIECVEMKETCGVPIVDWDGTPEPVVPLAEVRRRRVALYVAVVLILTAGTIGLALKVNERRRQTSIAEMQAVPSAPAPQSESTEAQEEAPAQNLTGEWRIVNTVQKTAYRQFDNMEIGFRLVVNQTGKEFTAKGEKVSENGRTLSASERTPIQVSGSIDGDNVVATFVENGAKRQTNGRFVWQVQSAGAGLTGTFMSTAARSSGKSSATKEL
ncbi:MAG TPA: DUF4388 domain-containing protein [Pyrinomonadaceae bacterium]|nr:DUF4388 domain-containing protein [Pyrinomonadaceae bacterium]